MKRGNLVLSVGPYEYVMVGDSRITNVGTTRARLAFQASRDIPIVRGKLLEGDADEEVDQFDIGGEGRRR